MQFIQRLKQQALLAREGELKQLRCKVRQKQRSTLRG